MCLGERKILILPICSSTFFLRLKDSLGFGRNEILVRIKIEKGEGGGEESEIVLLIFSFVYCQRCRHTRDRHEF
jgi:hypothetical protein